MKTVCDYGAVGDGKTDDSAAFQAAINSGFVIVPPTSGASPGYMIRSPLNATGLNSLTIKGWGNVMPVESCAYVLPSDTCTLLGGTGGVILDLTGSRSVTIEGVNFSSLAISSNPSTIGIMGGNGPNGGGLGYVFRDVTVAIANAGWSLPLYLNNANVCRFDNVSTIGKFGLVLCSLNPLGIYPPFSRWGPIIQSDSNLGSGCNFVGYGDDAVLWLEGANGIQFTETYCSYAGGAAGKSSYSGAGYAVRINNCSNVELKISNDYFPTMFLSEGVMTKVCISGLTCCGGNLPVPGFPAIGLFLNSMIKACDFDVVAVGAYPAGCWHYNTYGSALVSISDTDFLFDTGGAPNFLALDMSPAAAPVPFFNLRFRGNTDAPPMSFTVGGVAAVAGQLRSFMNGVRQGAA